MYELEIVRRHVLAYKKDKSDENFKRVLFLTDNLLVLIVLRLKKYQKWLRQVSHQELYHISVVGLYDALDKMPDDILAIKIPLWIMAYANSHIRKSYAYLKKDCVLAEDHFFEKIPSDAIMCNSPFDSMKVLHNTMLRHDIDVMADTGVITERERDVLVNRYFDGCRIDEIAEKHDVHRNTISNIVSKSIRKISAVIKQEEDYYMDEATKVIKEVPNKYCQYCRNYTKIATTCKLTGKFAKRKGTCENFERK